MHIGGEKQVGSEGREHQFLCSSLTLLLVEQIEQSEGKSIDERSSVYGESPQLHRLGLCHVGGQLCPNVEAHQNGVAERKGHHE